MVSYKALNTEVEEVEKLDFDTFYVTAGGRRVLEKN